MKIDIITVAWGDEYIQNYFDNLIPSIINNNIQDFNNFYKLNLIISISNKTFIDKFFNKIIELNINIILIDDSNLKFDNKYEKFNLFFQYGLKKTRLDYFIPMYPDMVISRNFLKYLLDLYFQNNYEIIFLPCPRTNLDSSIFFRDRFDWNSEEVLKNYILDNSHTKMKYMTWGDKFFNNSPAWLIFEFNNAQIYYCFHMTPLLVKKSLLLGKNLNDSLDTFLSCHYSKHSYLVINNAHNICWLSYEKSITPDNSFKNIRSLYFSYKSFQKINNKFHKNIGLNSFFLSNKRKYSEFKKTDMIIKSILKTIFFIDKFYKKV